MIQNWLAARAHSRKSTLLTTREYLHLSLLKYFYGHRDSSRDAARQRVKAQRIGVHLRVYIRCVEPQGAVGEPAAEVPAAEMPVRLCEHTQGVRVHYPHMHHRLSQPTAQLPAPRLPALPRLLGAPRVPGHWTDASVTLGGAQRPWRARLRESCRIPSAGAGARWPRRLWDGGVCVGRRGRSDLFLRTPSLQPPGERQLLAQAQLLVMLVHLLEKRGEAWLEWWFGTGSGQVRDR